MFLGAGSHSGLSNGGARSRHHLRVAMSILLSKSQCSIHMAIGEIFNAAQSGASRRTLHGRRRAVTHRTANPSKMDYSRSSDNLAYQIVGSQLIAQLRNLYVF
jgi:hypothetical protein